MHTDSGGGRYAVDVDADGLNSNETFSSGILRDSDGVTLSYWVVSRSTPERLMVATFDVVDHGRPSDDFILSMATLDFIETDLEGRSPSDRRRLTEDVFRDRMRVTGIFETALIVLDDQVRPARHYRLNAKLDVVILESSSFVVGLGVRGGFPIEELPLRTIEVI